MTPKDLETRWLSSRYWLVKCVLPSAITLGGLIVLLPVILPDPMYRKETMTIFAFFTLYFVLFRGGHMIMIRSMHFDLLKTYGQKYEDRLKALPRDLRLQNIGFTLAKIKRDLIHKV